MAERFKVEPVTRDGGYMGPNGFPLAVEGPRCSKCRRERGVNDNYSECACGGFFCWFDVRLADPCLRGET